LKVAIWEKNPKGLTYKSIEMAKKPFESGTTATQAKGKRFIIFDPERFQGFEIHTPVTLSTK